MQTPLGRIQYENILPVHFYGHGKKGKPPEIIFAKCYKSIGVVQFMIESIKIQLIALCFLPSILAFNGFTKKVMAFQIVINPL